MSKLPFMALYVADYDAATNWCDLETDGLYMRVLRLLWSTPQQSIPNDEVWIKRKLRIDQRQFDIFLIIKAEFLNEKNGRIYQKRLSDEFNKAETIHNSKVSNGSKGGKAKALKTNKKKSSEALAKPKQISSKALASTSTLTDTIIDKKESTAPKGAEYVSAKGKKLKGRLLEQLNEFMDAFGDKRGKAEVADKFYDLKPDEDLFLEIINGARGYCSERKKLVEKGQTPKMAQGWMTKRRWEDYSLNLINNTQIKIKTPPDITFKDEWEEMSNDLADVIGVPVYNTWFGDCDYLGREVGMATLRAPTRFIKDELKKYSSSFKQATGYELLLV